MSGKDYDSSDSSWSEEEFGLLPQGFEPSRSWKFGKRPDIWTKNIYSLETNISWKHRLVHLHQSMSNNDDGN